MIPEGNGIQMQYNTSIQLWFKNYILITEDGYDRTFGEKAEACFYIKATHKHRVLGEFSPYKVRTPQNEEKQQKLQRAPSYKLHY
jgi:hypothetical protein